jgi:ERF superfamily
MQHDGMGTEGMGGPDGPYVDPFIEAMETTDKPGFPMVQFQSGYSRSPSISKLVTALAKAQGKFKSAMKESSNPLYTSKYADYNSCIEATQEALAEFDLAVVHFPVQETRDGLLWAGVTTLIAHSSGEWMDNTILMPVVRQQKGSRDWAQSIDPHSVGSAITYATRFAYQSILRLGREDDDGNAAQATAGAKIAAQHAPSSKGPWPDRGTDSDPTDRVPRESMVVSSALKDAKSMAELVAAYNAMTPVDKRMYIEYFQLRRAEFAEANG